jgi:hypothetical protein
VPYIHCPECRLTVYGGIAYKKTKRCPRCGTEMAPSPRPLFRSLGSKRPKPPSSPPANPLAGAGS